MLFGKKDIQLREQIEQMFPTFDGENLKELIEVDRENAVLASERDFEERMETLKKEHASEIEAKTAELDALKADLDAKVTAGIEAKQAEFAKQLDELKEAHEQALTEAAKVKEEEVSAKAAELLAESGHPKPLANITSDEHFNTPKPSANLTGLARTKAAFLGTTQKTN